MFAARRMLHLRGVGAGKAREKREKRAWDSGQADIWRAYGMGRKARKDDCDTSFCFCVFDGGFVSFLGVRCFLLTFSFFNLYQITKWRFSSYQTQHVQFIRLPAQGEKSFKAILRDS